MNADLTTGIGCFLDDEIHRLLGIGNEDFQALFS
jgi:hypothetical protein